MSSIGWDPDEEEIDSFDEPSVSADSTDLYRIEVQSSTQNFDNEPGLLDDSFGAREIALVCDVDISQDQSENTVEPVSDHISDADSVDLQELAEEEQAEAMKFLKMESRRKSLLTRSQDWE